ncbi:MAG TPA: GLPGLI family protein [Flavobacteriaceae bacterium]|nr:GLPGLI family protein [Flavobacteriaceae bacterium]
MKNTFLILLFCCLGIQVIKAQIVSGTVNYKVEADEEMMDDILNEDRSEQLTAYLRMMFKNQVRTLPYLNYQLDFNQNESSFKKIETMATDDGFDLDKTAANVGVQGVYHTNLEKDKTNHQLNTWGKDILITHSISDFNWEITKETKIIQGYQCYKATVKFKPDFGKGDVATAWFTKEIPFQFGPAFYSGLPGLILEVKQGYYTFYADKIRLDKKPQNIAKPTKGKVVKLADLEEVLHQMKMDYVKAR